MNEIAREEARLETAVQVQLAELPLFAVELISALGEEPRAVSGAIERLLAAGRVRSQSEGRFQLTGTAR